MNGSEPGLKRDIHTMTSRVKLVPTTNCEHVQNAEALRVHHLCPHVMCAQIQSSSGPEPASTNECKRHWSDRYEKRLSI